jgi:SNF2 family DNA or RNA helicase
MAVLTLGSIDGQTSLSARQESIKEYKNIDSETFIFLMSTRAGGMGVDLVMYYHINLVLSVETVSL